MPAEGEIDLGRDGRYETGQSLVLKAGSGVTMKAGASEPARVGLVGGESMDGPRYLGWNLISSSAERIEPARDDWHNWRFAEVPGEAEFIPLPVLPGKPACYP